MDSATKIKAMNQLRIQINKKSLVNPRFIETNANVTKKVVIKLIKLANRKSAILGIFIIVKMSKLCN
jgi:hypothetical protein